MKNSNSTGTRLAFGLVVLGLLLAPTLAQAKKRIAVVNFTGPNAERFQEEITRIIESRHSVVSNRQFMRAAQELGAEEPSNENAARIAERLNADGIVVGFVEREGRTYSITVRLREGRSGGFVETVNVKQPRRSLMPGARRKIRRRLLRAIADLPPVITVDDVEGDVEEGFVAPEDDVVDEEERVVDEDEDEDDADEDEEELDISDARKADLMARGRGLEVAGGASFYQRKLSFSYENELGMDAPQGYKGGLVPGAYVTGEMYPLAFDLENEGASRNLGITGVYDQIFQIQSRLQYTDQMGNDMEAQLPTQQVHWGIGAVYRYNLGDSPTDPTIKLSVRYNRFRFVIDKTAAPDGVMVDIPNVDYTYYDPGIAAKYPLSKKLAVRADARFILVTSVGEMQQEDQYGAASITGLDGDAGVVYMLNPRLSVRAGGRYVRIAYAFDGSGALTTDRDADADQDVFGALDSYLGGYATLGYVF
jgi:hypothetical protein